MKDMKFKAVILAGGSGERFWPLSTPKNPKQFLRVFGGESLIRQSVSRLLGQVRFQDIYIVTARDLVATTRRELPEIPTANIIGEPCRRDTAAAVALGVGAAGNGIVGVFSSDQMIRDVGNFQRTIKRAISLAKKGAKIVTIGISPAYPSTGFGYVDPKTKRFAEKPDSATAKKYLKKGYLWNAGMFIAKADSFRGAFAAYAPSVLPLAKRGVLRRKLGLYVKLPKISFDYAVMEKYPEVEVVPGDFGWDDVGSFSAFDKYFPHDRDGNVREGPCTVVESSSNICVARSARISLLGVSNLVVITTPNAVLVADKSRVAEMKKLFKK